MRISLAILTIGLRQMAADRMYLIFALGLPVLITWVMSFLPKEAGVYEMASLGVLVMFVAVNLITSAGAILEEKQKGTWQRLVISPVSYWQIMTGYFLKLYLLAWVQALILLGSGKYLFGAPWNRGYFETFVILAVYIFAITGLGLFLASLLKTQNQVQALAMALVMVGTMLGEVFFPIQNPPMVIQVISKISPQSWAAHALKNALTAGASLNTLTTPLLWMAGIGVVLLAAGVLKLKYRAA